MVAFGSTRGLRRAATRRTQFRGQSKGAVEAAEMVYGRWPGRQVAGDTYQGHASVPPPLKSNRVRCGVSCDGRSLSFITGLRAVT